MEPKRRGMEDEFYIPTIFDFFCRGGATPFQNSWKIMETSMATPL